ncbi:MAG: VWA domain-containing protein [Verrucomicrobiaceae bacterium]
MSVLEQFTFAHPWWLLLLLVVPVLIFFGYKLGVQSWVVYPTLRVLGTLGYKPKDKPWRIAPLVLPLLLIPPILAMARPQWQNERSSRTASGIDILVALDISASMEARDFQSNDPRFRRPQRRIDAAREVLLNFIEERPDDRIGIVTFSGRPYTVAPLTLDHNILKLKIAEIILVSGRREEGGTAIGSAINAASLRLDQQKDSKSKVVVLITDGANNSGKISPEQAAELSADLGIKIYTIAIGTEGGRIVGVPQQEYDEETLMKIASLTKGEFFRAKDLSDLKEAFKSIDALEKTEVEHSSWIQVKEYYPWFLAPGVIALAGYFLFSALNPPPAP